MTFYSNVTTLFDEFVKFSNIFYERTSKIVYNQNATSCAVGRHNMLHPCDLDLWPFDLQSGVRITCDVGYLCANFSLPRPLCSRLRPDVRDRQTRRQTSDSIIA